MAYTPDAAYPLSPETQGLLVGKPPVIGTGEGWSLGGWSPAPVRWGGQASYDYRLGYGAGSDAERSHIGTVRLNGVTYIYAPWMAMVSGNLGLTKVFNLSQTAPTRSEDIVTGNVRLNMFSRSHFPMEVSLDVTDNRTQTDEFSQFLKSKAFSVQQSYRPPGSNSSYNFRLSRLNTVGETYNDVQNNLAVDYGSAIAHHNFGVGLNINEVERRVSAERGSFRSLNATHSYTPSDALNIASNANLTNSQDVRAGQALDVTTFQLFSTMIKGRPTDPLTLTGTVRGLFMETDYQMANFGVSVGANYRITDQLLANGSLGASYLTNDGRDSRYYNSSFGVNWSALTRQFGEWQYDLNSSATGSFGDSDVGQLYTVQALIGQSGRRSWALGSNGGTLSFNVSQSLTATRYWERPPGELEKFQRSGNLIHMLGVSWAQQGDGRNTRFYATLSDSREIGGGRAAYQLFTSQLSGDLAFESGATLNGDIGYQRSWQRTGDIFDPTLGGMVTPGQTSANAGVTGSMWYRHPNVFGVRRLTFVSRLQLTQDRSNIYGALALNPDRASQVFENRFEWQMGRLQSRFGLVISRFEGVQREYLTWRIQRDFGD